MPRVAPKENMLAFPGWFSSQKLMAPTGTAVDPFILVVHTDTRNGETPYERGIGTSTISFFGTSKPTHMMAIALQGEPTPPGMLSGLTVSINSHCSCVRQCRARSSSRHNSPMGYPIRANSS